MTIKILGIIGSVRPLSRTGAMVRLVNWNLKERGVESSTWSLRERPLPIMDPDLRAHPERITDPNVREFMAQAALADGFVLGTPVFHWSFSGVLKNAIDHLSSEVLSQKAFGLLSHGGRQSTQPLADLANVVEGCGGIVIPTRIATDDSHLDLDAEGRVTGMRDRDLADRIDRFCGDLIRFAAIGYALRLDAA
ncbi:MAG: NAD(P)H-dependent oxidoreductase [Gemmatimonadales bacterium]|nr:NAD(P)H-dependent oxidoreductase [Gemmatimonadales bacterium]